MTPRLPVSRLPGPRLSVIVPVHAQWELVPGLLAALAAQTLAPAAFEVLVVDNDPAPVPGDAPPAPVPGDDTPAPVPGDDPSAPVPGDDPSAPVPGDDPSAPVPGDDPSAPVPGDDPSAPVPGDDPSAPVPGDDPSAPVPGDPPAGPPARALPPNARVLACAAPGSYAARNAGAAAARGEWLVFTDADCLPDPGWLAALDAAAAAAPGTLLAGAVRMIPPERPNAYALYDLIRGIPQAAYVARGYAATANLVVPRAVFEALSGFDPARRSGGDADLCRRAGRAGHGLRLVAGAAVGHPCRTDWAALVRKARRIKGGQIAAGPLPRRIAWTLRTLSPPVGDTRAYLAAPHPWRHRLLAVAVRVRLWGVELAETARLLLGGEPERR